MALAKKCDRCGKFYEHYPIDNQTGALNAIKRAKVSSEGEIEYMEKYKDLCPECMDKLNKFLKGE